MASNHILVEFSIAGQNEYGRGILDRDIASRTVALINYQLRNAIQTRIVVRDGEVSFPFKIGRAGPENAKKYVRKGDIGYWTQSHVLIVFLASKEIAYPVNIVGQIQQGSIKFFKKLRIGRSIKIERVQSAIDEEDYL
ncbi:hypothetical protein CEE45_03775 [Candidatus Heimdallarchaeota archaeon B3_Heim]|nr:MAG: hypothetical protein CEE45_03775 [Candidatus Heimdallarchaeota archaeon B3_Heim]